MLSEGLPGETIPGDTVDNTVSGTTPDTVSDTTPDTAPDTVSNTTPGVTTTVAAPDPTKIWPTSWARCARL